MTEPDMLGNGKANYSVLLVKIINVNAKTENDAIDMVNEYMFGELQFGPNDILDIFKVKTLELK